jgi:hypothetical protein
MAINEADIDYYISVIIALWLCGTTSGIETLYRVTRIPTSTALHCRVLNKDEQHKFIQTTSVAGDQPGNKPLKSKDIFYPAIGSREHQTYRTGLPTI